MDESGQNTALERRLARLQRRQPRDAEADRSWVMLVDDEPENLAMLVRVLNSLYDVSSFDTGVDALAAVKERGCPDLILSDQRMAIMSGVQFLTQVKRLHPEAVAIILSGYTDPSDMVSAINDAQVFAYLTKPCETGILLDTVARAIKLSAVKKTQARMSEDLESVGNQMRRVQGSLDKHSAGRSFAEITSALDRLTANLASLDD